MVLLIGGLVLLYFFTLRLSASGWGYAGYRGYHRGPSFFYWGGGASYYGKPSLKGGSLSGPSHLGGGPSRGK